MNVSPEEIRAMRIELLLTAVKALHPDAVLVDKHPFGASGEFKAGLNALRKIGGRAVLGLRDIMDDQDQLAEEWDRKAAMPALENLYDNIWVYGSDRIYDPLAGLSVSNAVRRKMTYTGYLRRNFASDSAAVGSKKSTLPDNC